MHNEVIVPGFLVNGTGGHNNTALSGRTEFYYKHFWEINNLFGTHFSNGSPLIGLKDATSPVFNVVKEHIVASSLEYKFAKSIAWDDIKVTWYDSKGLLNYMRDWRKSVWTPQCGLKAGDEYKKRSVISNYLPTGQKTNQWTLFNSWPSMIKSGDLTYTDSDVKIVEVTISYDWAEEQLGAE